MMNAILIATGSALAAAVLVLFTVGHFARRSWERAARQCREQLGVRRARLAKRDADVSRVDAIALEHLSWTLKCATKHLGDVDAARKSGGLEALVDALVRFRDGISYFDGYSAAMDLLTAAPRDGRMGQLWVEARRELLEAADRMSKLGWSLDGAAAVRVAMQEVAATLRSAAAEPPDGIQAVAEALAKANRTLFAAMVEADTSK